MNQEYTPEQIDAKIEEICLIIEEGTPVRQVLKMEGMPSSSLFYKWLEGCETRAKRYAHACALRAESIFDEILVISDNQGSDVYINSEGEEVVNYNIINRNKLQVDARKWVLAKMEPKKYGDKTDITSGGEKIKQPFMIVPDSIANQMLKDVDDSSVQNSGTKK